MAPRPYENNFRVRLSKTGSTPAIYAISSGPQKGVHMLSSEPLPPSLQYLYRHPINIHASFLDISGDFLRRRFDTIEAAQAWIDEMDTLRRTQSADDSLADRLAEGLSLSPAPSRAERRRDPVWRGMPDSFRSAGGLGVVDGMRGLGVAGRGGFRVGKRYHGVLATAVKEGAMGGRYSRSHTGVRRAEVVGVLQRRHSEADVVAATAAVAKASLEAGREEAVVMED